MKVLALSDSHGASGKLMKIIEKEKPDFFAFCGDGIKDILKVCDRYPTLLCYIVTGNCDVIEGFADNICADIGPLYFYVTHGHYECVKAGTALLKRRAEKNDVDIVLYGHTHRQEIEREDGMVILNPGSAAMGNYAVIEIPDEKTKDRKKLLEKCSFTLKNINGDDSDGRP